MIYMKNHGSKRSIIVHQINQDYIRAFCFRSKGFAPTYRELMNMLGLTSPSTLKGLLDALKRNT
ncbi:hypothetical protein [Bacillus spizizenii]|uniref:LexA family protein n=1 Tax=Bacillus subtilis group TaxID=653685 RepID=UPI0009AD9422|nr:hypothetical protein BSU04nite_37660 [Bacillus spizizenii]